MDLGQPSTDPGIVITSDPIFVPKKLIHWKNITNDETLQHNVIVSLLSWDQINRYNLESYPLDSQKAGKVFIHFPLYKKDFVNIYAVTNMINRYSDRDDKIFVFCPYDFDKIRLFIGYCMVSSDMSVDDANKILKLNSKYKRHLQNYSKYKYRLNDI